jgi:hypothetical protein
MGVDEWIGQDSRVDMRYGIFICRWLVKISFQPAEVWVLAQPSATAGSDEWMDSQQQHLAVADLADCVRVLTGGEAEVNEEMRKSRGWVGAWRTRPEAGAADCGLEAEERVNGQHPT